MRLSILLFASAVVASPFPGDRKQEPNYLIDRNCASYCGFSSQLCCSAGQVCYTDANNQAQCSAAPGVPVSTVVVVPAAVTATCRTDQGQTQCGSGCCDAGQVCQGNGVCVGARTTVTFTSSAATATVVGQTTVTVSTTAAISTSTTVTTTSTTSNLDGGSIAGIIIGVVVGIIVLVWMCGPITNSTSRSEKSSGSVSKRSRR